VDRVRRWVRTGEFRVEALIAASMGAVSAYGVGAELSSAGRPPASPSAVGGYALALLAAAVLVARRRYPVAVSLIGLACALVYTLAGYPGLAPALALFVAFYSVAAYSARGGVPVGLCLVVLASIIPALPPEPSPWLSFQVLGPSCAMGWAVILGAVARTRRLATEARVREGVAEERMRIARELHDVLAHTISTIAVHSGLALDTLDSSPDQARAALETVRSAARQARPELRAALGLLRGDHGPGMAPQPGLAQLPDLVEQARTAGLRVELTVPGGDAALSPLLELTAYRIVQEALTNVIRHAEATEVSIAVRLGRDGIVIDVADDGHAPGEHHDAGLGLLGMRERAQTVGGDLTAGPRPNGGFQVHADLPVERP
jgi:signal transduction histidine kinase